VHVERVSEIREDNGPPDDDDGDGDGGYER